MTNKNCDWEFLKKNIYYTNNGKFRNIFVYDLILDDWKTFVDYLNSEYNIIFKDSKSEILYNRIDIEKVIEYWNGINEDGYLSTVKIGRIKINCFFNTINFIEMDIDCFEFDSLNEHIEFMDFLKNISKLLNKTVCVEEDAYNEEAKTLIEVNADNVEILKDAK